MDQITELLKAWGEGDTEALNRLVPLVDHELRKIAHNYMRNERPGHILQTTALVNEALMKMIGENISWENRKQFYALVARRMRQVLVDYARKDRRVEYTDVDEALIPDEKPKELLMLDEALSKLADIDERKATIVECRYFIGLTLEQMADMLGVAPSTVERDWRFARSWLKREMTGEPVSG